MSLTKRQRTLTISFAAMLMTIATALSIVSRSPLPSPPAIVRASTPIQHLVVIMKENHAFDNYFGTFPGADDIPSNVSVPDGQGGTTSPHWINSTWTWDLPHTREAMLQDYDHGKNDLFAVTANSWVPGLGNVSMGYYDKRQLAYYWWLASNYTIADHYFASLFGPTIPNRLFSLAGQAGGITTNPFPMPRLTFPSIFDQMEAEGIGWRYYFSLSLLSLPLPSSFTRVANDPDMMSKLVTLDHLLPDIASGNLPNVTFVDPQAGLSISEHPPDNVTVGEAWTASVVSSVMAGPQWGSTAIFLTWDESGGFYDHVPPPQLDQWGYGFRVPMIVVSPYAKRGFIDHDIMDHTSMLKFVATNWGLPSLTRREAQANDMLSAFDFGNGTETESVPDGSVDLPAILWSDGFMDQGSPVDLSPVAELESSSRDV